MLKILRLVVLFCYALMVQPVWAGDGPVIEIPVTCHLVTGLKLQKQGVTMTTWLDEQQVANQLIPETNRIWQAANIRFVVQRVVQSPALAPANQAEIMQAIASATRDDKGQSDPKRIQQLNQLIDWAGHNPQTINVYFVPYLGQASQGNAAPKKQRIFLGQWSDKPSKGKFPPEPMLLVETLPFKQGSIGRTLAHELGHILGLKHPDKKTQKEFGLLMGGKNPGYHLTVEEITKARKKAKKWQR